MLKYRVTTTENATTSNDNNSLNLGLGSDKALIVETGKTTDEGAKWLELAEKGFSFIYIAPYAFECQQLNAKIFVMAKLNLIQKSLRMVYCKIQILKASKRVKSIRNKFRSSFQECLLPIFPLSRKIL